MNYRLHIGVALTILPFITLAQSFGEFIDHVNGLESVSDKQAAADSFIYAAEMFPYLEDDIWAHFIYQGEANSVVAVGDFNSWSAGQGYLLEPLDGTDLFYHSRVFESYARLDYKYIINSANWILDPLNPNTVSGGFGPNSELAMPGYEQPWEIEYHPDIPHGTMENLNISSTATGNDYDLRVYLPPEYDGSRETGYPVIYFQDGLQSINFGSAVNVIDNLIDEGNILDIIAVFVEPHDRNSEYGGAARHDYLDFFVDELVPFIDSGYNTFAEADFRAITGASLGGNISAYIAYTHPGVFGNCGIHSGAMWVNGDEVFELITGGEPVNVRMVNIWGTYESLDGQMSALSDHFETSGYRHLKITLPEGHSWGLWRATFDDMLEFFFSSLPTSVSPKPYTVEPHIRYDASAKRLYYAFRLDREVRFSIRVVDMEGKTAYSKGYTGIGSIEGNLNVELLDPGMYQFVLDLDGHTTGSKFVVVR